MRLLLPVLLLGSLTAADLAVAPPPLGNDGNAGTAASPYATLVKALARAGSGDTVHVLRGGTYRETGLDFHDGVTVRASGPEDRPAPVITTSLLVPAGQFSDWSDRSGVLTVPVKGKVLAVHVDGVFCRLARFPNEGWLRSTDGTTQDLLTTDPATLRGGHPTAWAGAQVRWRRWSWWWETRPITSVDGGGRLRLGPENRFKSSNTGLGSAFCIDDCLAELDAPGEWFHDAGKGQLYLKPPKDAGDKPRVEIVVEPDGYKAGACTLVGLTFARIAGTALSINDKARIEDCHFEQIEENAIDGGWNGGGTVITGCSFRDVRNVAIAWNENKAGAGGTVIEGNDLRRIGMEFGYGGSGSWHAAGIIISNAPRVTVRRNRLIDVGYAGIILGDDGQLVERNVFVRCMGSLNDGAAIYANSSRNELRENIILDTVGNLETSHFWYPLGHGIWPEFLSDFREQKIIGNTVFGSGGNGLSLTNNYQCEVRDNVLVGNRSGGLHMSGHGKSVAQNHAITGNVLVVQDPSRRIPQLQEQIPSNWSGNDHPRAIGFEPGIAYGRMSGTTVVIPPTGAVASSKGGKSYSDAETLHQEHSWADAGAKVLKASSLLLINDTDAAFTFTAPRGGWSTLDGKGIKDGVEVAPYRSVVLVVAKEVDGLPPFLTASGIDYRSTDAETTVAEAKTGAKAAKTSAARPSAAAASPDSTPRPEAWTTFVNELRERTLAATRGPRPPRFTYSVLRGQVTVLALDGDQATLDLAGSGEMTADLFGKITPADAFALAREQVQGQGDLDGNTLAAFFARCACDHAAYQEHLSHSGPRAEQITAGFPAP